MKECTGSVFNMDMELAVLKPQSIQDRWRGLYRLVKNLGWLGEWLNSTNIYSRATIHMRFLERYL